MTLRIKTFWNLCFKECSMRLHYRTVDQFMGEGLPEEPTHFQGCGHAFGQLQNSICPLEVDGAATLHREIVN